jgi:hypothetical protein
MEPESAMDVSSGSSRDSARCVLDSKGPRFGHVDGMHQTTKIHRKGPSPEKLEDDTNHTRFQQQQRSVPTSHLLNRYLSPAVTPVIVERSFGIGGAGRPTKSTTTTAYFAYDLSLNFPSLNDSSTTRCQILEVPTSAGHSHAF